MVARGMQLTRPPPPPDSIPPSGLKIWPGQDAPATAAARDQDLSPQPGAAGRAAGKAQAEAELTAARPTGALSWRDKQRRVVIGRPGDKVLSLGVLLAGAAGAWGAACLLFLVWWQPHLIWMGGATSAGLLGGLAYSWMYFANVRAKEARQQVVSRCGGAAWVRPRGGGWWWRRRCLAAGRAAHASCALHRC
jgi:hypothetical protein